MTTKQCSLECDITTLTHPRPKWKWSSPVGGVLNKWIAMPCSRKKGQVENIKCTGSVHGLESKCLPNFLPANTRSPPYRMKQYKKLKSDK